MVFKIGLVISSLVLPFFIYMAYQWGAYGVVNKVMWLYVLINFINYYRYNPRLSLQTSFYLSLILLLVVMASARLKYYKITREKSAKTVEYSYKDKFYDGYDLKDQIYAGETSGYYFVYLSHCTKCKKMLAIKKDNIGYFIYNFSPYKDL